MASPDFKGLATAAEIYNVYKIFYMPFEILVKFFLMTYVEACQKQQQTEQIKIDGSNLSSHYKRLALVVHPDKNKHQYAKEAFQKLAQAYELCKTLV